MEITQEILKKSAELRDLNASVITNKETLSTLLLTKKSLELELIEMNGRKKIIKSDIEKEIYILKQNKQDLVELEQRIKQSVQSLVDEKHEFEKQKKISNNIFTESVKKHDANIKDYEAKKKRLGLDIITHKHYFDDQNRLLKLGKEDLNKQKILIESLGNKLKSKESELLRRESRLKDQEGGLETLKKKLRG